MADGPDRGEFLQRFAAGRYRPTTFLERGVTLPLTTPQLLGARVRPAERRGLELVLPNPSGGDGDYVLPWAALSDFCSPTLHDRALWEAVSAIPLLTPSAVREAARRVAAEGYAGRAAARAADAAIAGRQEGAARAQYELLLLMIRQGEPPNSPLPPPERDHFSNVQLRVRSALKRNAEQIPSSRALEVVEELAMALSGCGVRADAPYAALVRLTRDLRGLAEELTAWSDTGSPEDRSTAEFLASTILLTCRCADRSMTEFRGLTANMWELLRRWDQDPDRTRALATRADWLLDGWDTVAALWRTAEPEMRAAALGEMALIVPVIPVEARALFGSDASDEMERSRSGLRGRNRTVTALEDWITGRVIATQVRRESLRESCA
jgi:hypothetical protein